MEKRKSWWKSLSIHNPARFMTDCHKSYKDYAGQKKRGEITVKLSVPFSYPPPLLTWLLACWFLSSHWPHMTLDLVSLHETCGRVESRIHMCDSTLSVCYCKALHVANYKVISLQHWSSDISPEWLSLKKRPLILLWRESKLMTINSVWFFFFFNTQGTCVQWCVSRYGGI